MNAIAVTFPMCKNVLCIWHINKNVGSKCKGFFKKEDEWKIFLQRWKELVYSSTVNEFNQNMNDFSIYKITNPDAYEYILQTWLPWKERFVTCYVKDIRHFNSVTTSRVEGSHRVLKSYIKNGKRNLLEVVKNLNLLWKNQTTEISKEIERQKLIVCDRHKIGLLKPLQKKLSLFALHEILKQYKKSLNEEEMKKVCTQSVTGTLGLPCKHTIRELVEEGQVLTDAYIDSQWLLELNASSRAITNVSLSQNISPRKNLIERLHNELYNNPQIHSSSFINRIQSVLDDPTKEIQDIQPLQRKKGRPVGAKNKGASIRRDKSHFEYMEGRKCSKCGEPGHNARTCSKS